MVVVYLAFIGNIIHELDTLKIKKWKSSLFQLEYNFDSIYSLSVNSDTDSWGYSDETLKKSLPDMDIIKHDSHIQGKIDLIIYVLDIPLQDNYFSRIIDNNRILITYYQIKEILQQENIPLENYLIKLIYTYVLLFKGKRGNNLSMEDEEEMAHDAHRGCIFDMCGVKNEIVYSCISLIVCDSCKSSLIKKNVSGYNVSIVNKELKRLKKDYYYRMLDFLKKHPILSLSLSGMVALLLNVLANLLCSAIGI